MTPNETAPSMPLRNEPVKIEDPFAPAVPPEDWNVLAEEPDYEDAGPITDEELAYIAAQACLELDREEAEANQSPSNNN